MKQHNPMVSFNYLSKCPSMYNIKFHSNRNTNWVVEFVMEIITLLNMKSMETHLNLWYSIGSKC